MFLTTAGAGALSAGVDVPQDGTIEGITLGCGMVLGGGAGDGDGCSAEVSFGSQDSLTVHDSRVSLCTVGNYVCNTAGSAQQTGNHNNPFCTLTPLSVPVSAGERLYLHTLQIGALPVFVAVAYIFIRDGAVNRTRIRNR
jgi:hypothetical protein